MGDGSNNMVLDGEDVARAPAKLGTKGGQGLDEDGGLDGHVEGIRDAGTLHGLGWAIFGSIGYVVGHLHLGKLDLKVAEVGFGEGHQCDDISKVAMVCGYGDVGKGCASTLKHAGALVIAIKINSIHILQVLIESIPILTLEDVISKADIFMIMTGNKDIIMVNHKRKMKNNAVVCNMATSIMRLTYIGSSASPSSPKLIIGYFLTPTPVSLCLPRGVW
ncbi:hypothetical protein COCNU_01G015510 [Cocos nucifera]|uniref:Adenosylhomocysteinase n=1 Tax=Cocos nucifera TaxID=13894 RepID=A0A8K0HVV4_COCNU|nr:hypothetical protein COCNU_01G015510 [Cocos nucifera]